MSTHAFRVHFDGIIELLARNLYADPDVFVREMIQNAHDAIMKRRRSHVPGTGDRAADLPEPRIRITADRVRGTLEFSDPGAGLSEAEIHDFLSTIAASDKRGPEGALPGGRGGGAALIGRFGIGLLSGFIVADQVDVNTRAEGHPPLAWSSRGDGSYALAAGSRAEIGTTVRLHLRSEHRDYLDPRVLTAAVRRYADLIGIPIHLGSGRTPINRVHAPWHLLHADPESFREAHATFWAERFPEQVALELVPLAERLRWREPDGTEREGGVQGVLGVSDRLGLGIDSRGRVDLYVARMFIGADLRTVLPEWATFLCGVVECDALEPNAARDNVLPTPALREVQEVLGRAVVTRLTWMAYEEPRRLSEILRWHSVPILLAALRAEHQAFFEAIADIFPLESSQGPVTLRQLRRRRRADAPGPVEVLYTVEMGAQAQSALLARAGGRSVVYAGALVEPLLQRYAERWPERIRLTRLDREGADLVREADEPWRSRMAPLQRLLAHAVGAEVRIGEFDPPTLPVVVLQSPAGDLAESLEEIADNPALPSYLRDVATELAPVGAPPPLAYLNAGNKLLQQLASDPSSPETATAVLAALYRVATLARGRMPSAAALDASFQDVERLARMALTGTGR